MSYSDHVKYDRRLRILQLLASDTDYSLNTIVLKLALSDFSHNISDDLLLADVYWLCEQDLLTISKLPMKVVVVTATGRGVDVAYSRAKHPSVRRPTVSEIQELRRCVMARVSKLRSLPTEVQDGVSEMLSDGKTIDAI